MGPVTCIRCGTGFHPDARDPTTFPAMQGGNKWTVNLSDHCTPCWMALLRLADLWNGMSVRFHWLGITFRGDRVETLSRVAALVYGCSVDVAYAMFKDAHMGMNGYKHCAVGPHGVRLMYSDDELHFHIAIPGEACDCMPIANALKLFQLNDATFARIDVALDGLMKDGKALSPVWVYQACDERPDEVRTRVSLTPQLNKLTGLLPDNLTLICGRRGKTCYLGAKQSERYLCVYDQRGFTRMELRMSGDYCREVVDVFDGRKPADVPRVIVGLIRSFVDFVEPGASKKCRAKLQQWWSDIVDGADKIACAVPRKKPVLDESWRYFLHQWSAFLATSLTAAGGDFDVLCKLVAEGTKKMTARHDQMVVQACGQGVWVPCWQ